MKHVDPLLGAYKTASTRFIEDTIERDGQTFARITDPVTGLSGTVPIDQQWILSWLFRGEWLHRIRH